MKGFMKSTLLAVAVSLSATSVSFAAENVRLTGSGASFPAPIYLTWFKDFSKKSGVSGISG
ncbi:hypothetical protein ABI36_0218580 [Pseudomonas aeruginosa]|nr:hypothetical protein Q094_06738 [Pseudomonas aeruginosa PS42]OHW57819.1 hypothetical protein ABI36_0218580 [Pseudomonas aeruginosa]